MNYVVDTNVLLVSDGQASERDASRSFQNECDKTLGEIRYKHHVVIDDQWLLLSEYTRKINFSGQSVAIAFLRWVMQEAQIPGGRVKQVHVTATNSEKTHFAEAPAFLEEAGFDPSDRKFVVVAHLAKRPVTIVNAIDTDWHGILGHLTGIGVKFKQLCPEDFKVILCRKGLQIDA